MIRRLSLALSLFVPLTASSLPARPAAGRALRVVASVGDLGAIAREVLGPGTAVVTLAKPNQDPHFVDAKPSFMIELARADALCVMGLGYEIGWLPTLIAGARNPAIRPGGAGYLDASAVVPVLEVPTGPVDRSMGDVHPGGNPHFTLDPRNGARVARAMAERFGLLDPAGRDGYRRNAEAFVHALEARIADWQRQAAALRGMPVVTYHRSFVYLTAWLGLDEIDALEPKPGIPPTSQHVAEVLARMRARKVRTILQESWYPTNTADFVVRQTGARLVLLVGMTPQGSSYAEHIDAVVRALLAGVA